MAEINFPGDQPSKAVQRLCDVVEKIISPVTTWIQGKADASQIRSVARAETETAALRIRAQMRLEREHIRHQRNLEAITSTARQLLLAPEPDGAKADQPPVSEDWAARFFAIAQEVSDEEMQTVWSKILAGEARRPNSYSLRTLDVVKNLTSPEAQLFQRLAKFAIRAKCSFVYHSHGSLRRYGFDASDIIQLADAGLLAIAKESNEVAYLGDSGQAVLDCGNKVLEVKCDVSGDFTLIMSAFLFTTAGAELLNLVEIDPAIDYLDFICRCNFWKKDWSAQCYPVTRRTGEGIEFDRTQNLLAQRERELRDIERQIALEKPSNTHP